ncbi:MAG: HAD family phosphatase [Cryobacterium sp.]|nr:HAD family phosphatase [Cryobacterium sp.]
MDGTLVDSEPYWMEAESALVSAFGGEWTAEDGRDLIGAGLYQSASIFQRKGVDLSATEIVEALSQTVLDRLRRDVPWRPGVLDLIADLRSAGIPCGIVTMSLRPAAAFIAERLGIEHVVSGSDVANEKPHPEAYVSGAALFNVDAAACVAIEDSINGLRSAVASGARSLAVPSHQPIPENPDYTVWPTLDGRTADDIIELFAARKVA